MVEVCTPNATLQLKLCGIERLENRWISINFLAISMDFRGFWLVFSMVFGRKSEISDGFPRCRGRFCGAAQLRNTINTISMMSKAMAPGTSLRSVFGRLGGTARRW